MKIALTQGYWMEIDDCDAAIVAAHTWSAHKNKEGKVYARATMRKVQASPVYLHRFLMGLTKGDRRHVDHWNHNTLDNRRENLRVVVPMLNHHNRGDKNKNNTSGHPGVCWHKQARKWVAAIMVDRKAKHLGLFANIEDAAAAYRAAKATILDAGQHACGKTEP